ncbi:MAG: hypothetical protein KDJ66_10375, partial [Nitratireductor sp.]|nr:hypothetical protein [Nitratireductor sp.]
MCAAFQALLGEAGSGQHPGRCLDMHFLAIVRGTGKRNLVRLQPEPVGSPRFDQRQCLKGLDRRTREYGP